MPQRIVILTGPPGSGKTTFCRQLTGLTRSRGVDCAGLICPARFYESRKVGIDAAIAPPRPLLPLPFPNGVERWVAELEAEG